MQLLVVRYGDRYMITTDPLAVGVQVYNYSVSFAGLMLGNV
jgi:hypothetical protein